MKVETAPITRLHDDELREWIRAVVGRELVGVRYRMLSGSHWVHSPMPAGVHEVDWDVVFRFDDEKRAIVGWSMDKFVEGLSLTLNGAAVADPMEEVDVSDSPEWRRLIDQRIVSVETAWHVPNEGCPETLWGIRLLGTHSSVAISLGKVDGGKLQYQPDAVIVLFDEEAAADYVSAAGSAYRPEGAGGGR